jgi:HPt (histidine-containing phosphotransfer) domain-containing protein
MSEKIIVSSQALDQYIDLMGDEGKEFIVDIIDALLEVAPDNIDQLDRSLVENNFSTFQRTAHTLKTNCATVGATELANKFLELEMSGTTGNPSSVSQVLEYCKVKFQQLMDELIQKKRVLTGSNI